MKESQNKQLIEILETGRWITPLEALEEIGCLRLPARVGELKKLGYDIEDEWVTQTNAKGQKKTFKRYRLRRAA